MRSTLLILMALAAFGCGGVDKDGDGYKSANDCDDDSDAINPGATEICDGIDNDCDGEVDEGVAQTWYVDSDGDGYGSPDITQAACQQPTGFVDNDEDCNDNSSEFKPGAAEYCEDPNDYNCDGSVGFEDADGDGVAACEDCNDTNAAVSPNNPEICDGIDNDCDGDVDSDTDPTDALTWYFDGDQDGFGDARYSINSCAPPFGYTDNDEDCNDSSDLAYPGGDEVCDELDNDCNGVVDGADAADAISLYTDADGDGYGDDTTLYLGCSIVTGVADQGGDCDDSNPDINPGEIEVCNDGIDNDCDNGPTTCEIEADAAALTLTGEDVQDYAGISFSGTADLDGDGNADLVVGASQMDTTVSAAGGAYVFYGPLSAGSASLGTADLVLEGSESGERAGEYIRNVGDFDNDGLSDLLITAQYADSNGINSGSVHLVTGATVAAQGATANLRSIADFTWAGDGAYDWLGAGATAAGDINGDGFDDFLAGATGDDTSASNSGSVYLFFGRASFTGSAATVAAADGRWTGINASDFMGSAIAGAGDLDGDGLDDFGVGLINGASLGGFTGSAYLVSGANAAGNHGLADADATVLGAAAGDRLGAGLAAAGDMDGDGRDDLWLGANRVDDYGADAGAAYLISGVADLSTLSSATVTSLAVATVYGGDAGHGLGAVLAANGDFDNDGVNDLLTGVPLAGLNGEGTAYLFLSPSSGTFVAGQSSDAAVSGDGNADAIGLEVRFGGDLLGTGGSTVLAGSWRDDSNGTDSGSVFVFSGFGL